LNDRQNRFGFAGRSDPRLPRCQSLAAVTVVKSGVSLLAVSITASETQSCRRRLYCPVSQPQDPYAAAQYSTKCCLLSQSMTQTCGAVCGGGQVQNPWRIRAASSLLRLSPGRNRSELKNCARLASGRLSRVVADQLVARSV